MLQVSDLTTPIVTLHRSEQTDVLPRKAFPRRRKHSASRCRRRLMEEELSHWEVIIPPEIDIAARLMAGSSRQAQPFPSPENVCPGVEEVFSREVKLSSNEGKRAIGEVKLPEAVANLTRVPENLLHASESYPSMGESVPSAMETFYRREIISPSQK